MKLLSNTQKAALASYVRSVIGAVLAVLATTGQYEAIIDPNAWPSLWKAAVAALIPPLIRWANPNDPAFGRTKS